MTDTLLTRRQALAAGALAAGGSVVGLAGIPGGSPQPVEGSWPLGRGDPANTGVADGPGPGGPATARWRFDAELVGGKAPVLGDGRCYVAVHESAPALVALEAATGTVDWRATFDERAGFPDAAAAIADGVVLVPFGDLLAGVDAEAGDVLWRYTAGVQFGAPVVVDGTAYVGVADPARVVALDPASGEVAWEQSLEGGTTVGLAVADDAVFVAVGTEESGRLVALDAADGSRRWAQSLDGPASAGPAVGDDGVYVPAEGGLHAVGRDGEPRFSFALPTAEESPIQYARGGSSPAVADGTVYVGAPDGHVYAVDATTGEREWAFWTWNAASGDPVVAGDTVYVGSDDSFVYALDAADGKRRWEFDTRGPIDGAGAAVVDGLLFVAMGGDGLYALEGP